MDKAVVVFYITRFSVPDIFSSFEFFHTKSNKDKDQIHMFFIPSLCQVVMKN